MMNKKKFKFDPDAKPVISASEFSEWLYCPYRYNFEKKENETIRQSNKYVKKTNKSKHKWIKN